MEHNTDGLFMARGTLFVDARGYWFTAGGEKGSFGFYPHLKDGAGYPVFPDTQIHGDLRMAAGWLANIQGDEDDGRNDRISGRVFGRSVGKNGAALLRISDLELADDHKSGRKAESFFEIKPRIRIGEAAGTVERHMLVEREHAWLEGCTLRATLWMGYFTDKGEMADCKRLVSEAAGFLGGFGGSRSRGMGRGTVRVAWDEDETVAPTDPVAPAVPSAFGYFLTALNHFRNKPPARGATQVVGGMARIRADQLRGWFVRAFRDFYGRWPAPEEMATLRFPTLYPSDGQNDRPGFPPPMSALRNEEGEVQDLWGSPLTRADDFDNDDENFFRTKTKPLSGATFVTADAPRPQILEPVRIEQRFRNAMDETFTTKKDGLFVQELVGGGTCFSGVFRVRDPQSPFAADAFRLLSRVRPDIKGTLFDHRVVHPAPADGAGQPDKPRLVIRSIRMRSDRMPGDRTGNGEQVTLAAEMRFNNTLGRPRRNRLVIAPGSVVRGSGERDALLAWPGFGGAIAPAPPKPGPKEDETTPPSAGVRPPQKMISRSQAGLLRDYLHPSLSESRIRENLKDRIEKYRAKSEKELTDLLSAIRDRLDSDGLAAMREFIRTYLEDLAVHLWEQKGGEDR